MKTAIAVALLLAGCIAAPIQAPPSNWYRLDSTGGSIEMDTTAVTRSGNTVTVPLRATFTPPRTFNGAQFDSMVTTTEYDCATLRFRVLNATSFYRGTRVDTGRTEALEWREQATGSTGARMATRACGGMSFQ